MELIPDNSPSKKLGIEKNPLMNDTFFYFWATGKYMKLSALFGGGVIVGMGSIVGLLVGDGGCIIINVKFCESEPASFSA